MILGLATSPIWLRLPELPLDSRSRLTGLSSKNAELHEKKKKNLSSILAFAKSLGYDVLQRFENNEADGTAHSQPVASLHKVSIFPIRCPRENR